MARYDVAGRLRQAVTEQSSLWGVYRFKQGFGGRVVRTVMEMLYGQKFYRDLLYHDAYGEMIHSNEFSGTPGDVAVRQVTEWLEEQGTGTVPHVGQWIMAMGAPTKPAARSSPPAASAACIAASPMTSPPTCPSSHSPRGRASFPVRPTYAAICPAHERKRVLATSGRL